MQLPIVDEHGFHGVVDLVTMEAFFYTPDGDGRGTPWANPAAVENDAKVAHEALIELVAEGKDELMEEFFAMGTIPKDHLISALHEAIREDRIFPVLYMSGLRNVGTDHLLDFLKVYVRRRRSGRRSRYAIRRTGTTAPAANGSHTETITRKIEDTDPTSGIYVYKTMVDPFAGRISFFKVISGASETMPASRTTLAARRRGSAHISVMQGRQADRGQRTACR